jgi:hypothetical protein
MENVLPASYIPAGINLGIFLAYSFLLMCI